MLSFSSDPEDYIGAGTSQRFTLDNATFHPIVERSGGYLSVAINLTDRRTSWGLVMIVPAGKLLAPGTYDTTPSDTPTTHGFTFFGDGRGCSAVGRLTIREIVFGPAVQSLARLRASWEQHCNGGSPALRGEIVILADPWR